MAYYAGVVRCVYLATGSREGALDATQEAFARLYPRWAKISRYERPDLWVRTVALRLARRAKARSLAEVPTEHDSTMVANVTTGIDPDLRRAIAALSKAQRTAIVLHYYEGLSVEELGGVMGCATSTAKVHLHRARSRLAELLSMEVDHVSG